MPKPQIVKFVTKQSPYNAGEVAGFDPEIAEGMRLSNRCNFIDVDGNITKPCPAHVDAQKVAKARELADTHDREARAAQASVKLLRVASESKSVKERLEAALVAKDDKEVQLIGVENGCIGCSVQSVTDAMRAQTRDAKAKAELDEHRRNLEDAAGKKKAANEKAAREDAEKKRTEANAAAKEDGKKSSSKKTGGAS